MTLSNKPLSKRSLDNLSTVHPDLKTLAECVHAEMPIEVICGYRGEKEQNEAFAKGNSKLKFPNSKHNKIPSLAIDCCPLPIDWNNIKAFVTMAEIFKKHAIRLGMKISCGADWEKFRDYPHVEKV